MKLNLECMLTSKIVDFFVIFLFKTFAREKCQDILKKYTKIELRHYNHNIESNITSSEDYKFLLKRLNTTCLEPTNQMH